MDRNICGDTEGGTMSVILGGATGSEQTSPRGTGPLLTPHRFAQQPCFPVRWMWMAGISTYSKTGAVQREIYVTSSLPYLRQYISVHLVRYSQQVMWIFLHCYLASHYTGFQYRAENKETHRHSALDRI